MGSKISPVGAFFVPTPLMLLPGGHDKTVPTRLSTKRTGGQGFKFVVGKDTVTFVEVNPKT